MARVVLLNPLAVINGKHVHFLRDWSGGAVLGSVVYPPLDQAYVASYLRSKGISTEIIDASLLHIYPRKLVELVCDRKPEFVGIPCAARSLSPDLELAGMIKEKEPSVKIVFSGPDVTLDTSKALNSGYVDYVILGELELPFLDIVQGMLNRNVAYRKNGKIVVTDRELLDNLDLLPFPARDLLPLNKYWAPFTKKYPFTMIQTARGCAYNHCLFCRGKIWSMGKTRFRSLDNTLEEIEEIVNKYRIKELFFKDQSLTLPRERIYSLCEKLLEKRYDVSWRCYARVDSLDRNLVRMMQRAGCYQVSCGFESGVQEILDLSQKGITIEDSRRAVEICNETGMEIAGAFIIGMCGDTEETIKRTIEFALSLNLDYAQFNVPPPPDLFSNSDGKVSLSFALSEQRRAYRKFYIRLSYALKKLKSVKSIRQLLNLLRGAVNIIHITAIYQRRT